jgi:two-component system phosphate regulon response regulator PhoB
MMFNQSVNLDKSRALICEASGQLRQGIRIGLNNLGMRNLVETSTFVAAHQACANEQFDLLILNAAMDGTDASVLLREMRLGQMGKDPFVIAVLLLASPDEVKVRQAVDSGPDDLLLIPFAPDQLMTRLRAIARRRKPFIVTHDYIGPDRRTNPRPGTSEPRKIAVPNPLQARVTHAPERYEQIKREAVKDVAGERIKRLAAATEWECKFLFETAKAGQLQSDSIVRSTYKLETVVGELMQRVSDERNHSTDGMETFLESSRALKNRPSQVSLGELDALHQAARRISTAYAGA